ncbi:MAG TPA: TonB-dependent receptor, partial [Novosphingobium sp.]|nr:TonB-dependent receptor [Novosphingobium sp.]
MSLRSPNASLVALGASLLLAVPAFAQEAAPAAPAASDIAPGDIVVTAQKRAERLQDVPLAVSAVGADMLAKRQINDTNSLVAAVPSLTFQQGANPTNTTFRIRGIGTALFGQGVESSVSTVVDGVVAARQAQGFSDLVDVERVEVLRGPQGTLFGKNASAGVVSVTTARPSKVLTANAEATIAQYGEYRLKGSVSGPITENVRARLSGFYNDVRGITRNVATNQWVNGSKSWGVRGKVDWDVTSNFNLLFSGEYRKTDSDCCASTLIAAQTPALLQVMGAVTPSRTNRSISEDTNTYANSSAQTYSMTGTLDLDKVTITSITAYQKYNLAVNQPIDRINAASPLYLGSGATYTYWNQNHGIVDLSAFSQELRIANRDKGRLNYVAGFFYMGSEVNRPFDRRRAQCTGGTLYQACPTANVVWQSASSVTDLRQKSYAAFAQLDYNLIAGLHAIGGLRVTHETGTNVGVRTAPIVAGDTVFPANASTSGTVSASDTALTGKVGLQYEFSRRAQVYASYTRGYKGRGYDMEISANFANQTVLQPEYVNAYELGFKGSTADHRYSIAAALFLADYSNLQVQANRSDPSTGVIQFVSTNAGTSQAKGVEIEATARPIDPLTINFALTYTKSTVNIDGLNCPLQLQAAAAVASGTPINTCYRPSAGATPVQNLRNA